VPHEIAILLALGAGLFDPLPLPKMDDAQAAIGTAMAGLPPEIRDRLSDTGKLTEADRAAVMAMLHHAVAPFMPSAPDDAKRPAAKPAPELAPEPAP
jgi:F-type H+-transporting ATPase subunit alpha